MNNNGEPLGENLTLVSYDIRQTDGATRSRVNRIVFGETSRKRTPGGMLEYHYAGSPDRQGALYVGQSVVLLHDEDARAMRDALEALRVPIALTPVTLRTESRFASPRP